MEMQSRQRLKAQVYPGQTLVGASSKKIHLKAEILTVRKIDVGRHERTAAGMVAQWRAEKENV